jgi:hypothetical protein
MLCYRGKKHCHRIAIKDSQAVMLCYRGMKHCHRIAIKDSQAVMLCYRGMKHYHHIAIKDSQAVMLCYRGMKHCHRIAIKGFTSCHVMLSRNETLSSYCYQGFTHCRLNFCHGFTLHRLVCIRDSPTIILLSTNIRLHIILLLSVIHTPILHVHFIMMLSQSSYRYQESTHSIIATNDYMR